MLDARFLKLKLDYTEIKDLAVGEPFWRVNCYPHGYSKEFAPQHLSIYLRLVSESENVKAIFEAFVMDKNGKPSSSSHPGRRGLLVYPPSKEWGWHQFMKGTDIESIYVTDGSVTIVCGVIITHDDDPLDPPLGRLLDSNDGSDVSFIIKGETFHAHRALLAARSPVFKAQLLGSMADAKMTSITMHDISAATFKAMLRFMYTDTLPADDELGASPLTEVFQDLLAMADRYALDRLKLICARKLWENLSTENVGATLACAGSCRKLICARS
uniref:BTB domain-containing protein n=1 Tax=Setaria viridis TaxID=4556 RepID=A0A4U6U6H4_SETVI|nr:hypothetical protein SEVIR_6G223700v2 [Setaria viridis]